VGPQQVRSAHEVAEETVETPAPPAPAAPSKEKSFVEQYDLGDTSPAPIHIPSASAATEETPAEPASPQPEPSSRPVPPKDPETGRFVARDAEPQPGRHSPRLVAMAVDYGIPENEIKEMLPLELERHVLYLHKQALQISRDNNRQRLLQSGGDALDPMISPVQDTPQPQPTQQPRRQAPPPEDEFTFDPADYDPNVAKALGIVRDQAKEIKQLKQMVQGLARNEQIRQFETAAQHLDRRFAEREEVFGKGTVRSIDPNSLHATRRRAVVALLDQFKGQPGTFDEKYDRIVSELYGAGEEPERETSRTPRIVREDEDEWARGGVARPTHREARNEPKGFERAVKAVSDKMRELELNGESGDLPPDSFLPASGQ
jgi:hypothetical protein